MQTWRRETQQNPSIASPRLQRREQVKIDSSIFYEQQLKTPGPAAAEHSLLFFWVLFVKIKRVFMSDSTLCSTGELNGSPKSRQTPSASHVRKFEGENCSRSTTKLTMKSTANSGNWGEHIFYLGLTSHPPPLFFSNTWNPKNSLLEIKRKVLFKEGWAGTRNSFHSERCQRENYSWLIMILRIN